jgi:hypothetical protein
MAYAAKSFTLLTRSVVSVSNNLSIATVLGIAALPLLPHGTFSELGPGGRPQSAAPIEIVPARPVPMAGDASSEPTLQRVARRRRLKREPPSEPQSPAHQEWTSSPAANEAATPAPAASHKTSSQPDPVQTQSPSAAGEGPGEAAQAEPSKPDVWSDAQVIAALRECVRLLAPIAADVEVSEPLKQEKCGAPAPVAVRRIGSGTNNVEISPPAIVNCAMVVGLHTWIEKTLQPAAQEAFGSRITRLRSASGYACRNRIGSHSHADRLSEHALANAIDIGGFVTADGRTIEVANSWGPTARDREAQRLSAASATEGASPIDKKAELPKAGRQHNPKIGAIANSAPEALGAKNRPVSIQTAQLQKLSSGASDAKAIPAPAAPGHEEVAKTAQAQFLRRLHKGACGVFATVLGPEANDAHRNHFHFDFAHRRRGTYCQ